MSRRNRFEEFEEEVETKERRLRRFRARGDQSIWVGLGMFGAVGWTVAVPMVLGTLLGVWIDRRLGGGIAWTLSLMALGLIVGGVNAWNWLEQARQEAIEEAMEEAMEDAMDDEDVPEKAALEGENDTAEREGDEVP